MTFAGKHLNRLSATPVQVSCTITFDPSKEGQHLAHALDYFQYQLKGVSFLPRMDYGAFPQVCVWVGWPVVVSERHGSVVKVRSSHPQRPSAVL